MPAKARADILLTISSDLADLRATQTEFARTRNSALAYAKTGTAFAAANVAISSSLNLVKNAIRGTMVQGVQFNAQLEQAELGVAAVLKQFNPEQYKTFNDAIKASTAVIGELRKQAVETPATFAELLEGFQSTAGAMAAANIPLEKQVQLVVMASQSMTTLGIATRELRQELTALMMGNIDRNARLAKTLGIESSDIARAKEQGRLYEFLTEKMAAFSEGAKLATQNITVLQSNLEDATTLQAADSTKELAEAYRELLKSLTALVKSDSFKHILEVTSGFAAMGTRMLSGVADSGRNEGLASGLAGGLSSSVASMLFIKAFNILSQKLHGPVLSFGVGLGLTLAVGISEGLIQATIAEGGAALDAVLNEARNRLEAFNSTVASIRDSESEAQIEASKRRALIQINALKKELADWDKKTDILRNTAFGKQELERISAEIAQYQRLIDLANSRGAAIAEENAQLAKQRQELNAIQKLNEERAKLTDKTLEGDAYKKAVDADKKAQFGALSSAQQVAELKRQIETAKFQIVLTPKATDFAKIANDGSDTAPTPENIQAAETLRLQASARLIALQQQLKKIEEQITKEREKQNNEADKAAEKTLRETLQRQEVALQIQLDGISAQRAAVDANAALTVGEKRRANLALLRSEIREMQKFIDLLISQKDAAKNDTERQLIQQRIDSAYTQLRRSRSEAGSSNDPVRGLEKFNAQLRQTGEDSDATFEILNGGFQGMASGMMDALTSAKSFGDGFNKVLSALGMGIANAIMQIVSMKIAMGIFTLGAGLLTTPAAAVGSGVGTAVTSGATAATSLIAGGGGSFMTSGRTNLTVGDNPGGVELVSVIPLSGKGTSRLNGRSLAMAGGGTAIINGMRSQQVRGMASLASNMGNAARGNNGEGGEKMVFQFNFQTGVTRQEVAALIPIIEQRTVQKVSEMQKRRK